MTVRGGGLVPPEPAADELHKVASALRQQGLSIPMITTTAADPSARAIFTAMGKLGIRNYKLGYYNYGDLAQWEAELVAGGKTFAN